MPRVTIGVPVRNGEQFLAGTIEAFLAQEFEDFELILSDNASTDATEEICREYVAKDERVRYSRNDRNLGAARNYNRLFELGRGEYFKWAGYDDICLPRYIRRCVETLDEAPPTVALAYPKTTLIDLHGDVISEYEDNLDLRSDDPVERLRKFTQNQRLCNPCFGLHRKRVLGRTRLVETYISSDVPLLADLALRGQFWEVPERLFLRRIHKDSSRQGDVTLGQVAEWFDSARTRRPLVPTRARLFYETLGVISRSELPPAQRRRAVAVYASTWSARRIRVNGGRVKRALRSSVGPPATAVGA